MRTQVTLTIISVCLLLCATLIVAYSIYADTGAGGHVTATADAWEEAGAGKTKASVKAPSSECYGHYSLTVQVRHKPQKHQASSFDWAIDKSLSLDGVSYSSNYAGAYISDWNSSSPHYTALASDTDRQGD